MVSIRALRPEDHRSGFRSGNEDLDRFFHRHAASNHFAEHIGVTYLAVEDDGRILGYVTIAGGSVGADSFPSTRSRRLPRYPLPVLRLARLAVSKEAQKRGIGTTLIRYVFAQALEKSLKIGCIGVVVDAKPSAVPFYERLGFERQEAVEGQLPTRPEPLPMFLSIALIKAGIGR